MPRLSPITHPHPVRTLPRSASQSPLTLSPLPNDGAVNAQLEGIVRSRTFSGAHRSQLFLRHILQHAVAHPGEHLKEYSIAVDVFGRDDSYDPAVNNTVRVEASRLRSRLREYYAGEGRTDPLLIEVPKGSYGVRFQQRSFPAPPLSFPSATPLRPARPVRSAYIWAVPLAFVVGALVGYRAAH